MNCPTCQKKMKSILFHETEVDLCETCLGVWFEKGELQEAKDTKEETLKWLDVDLWDKEQDFRISKEDKCCPHCSVPLYEVEYGDSETKIDFCGLCEGVWLERGEFKKIIDYLKDKGSYEIMNNYARILLEETSEIFTGPEPLKEEVNDLITVLGFLKYKLAGKYPHIAKIISNIPRP